MRRDGGLLAGDEREDQEFRRYLKTLNTEPDTIRHTCIKCRINKPSMECSDCFALLCQGCIRFYGHDPKHKVTFHHPENLPHNLIPGVEPSYLPPDMMVNIKRATGGAGAGTAGFRPGRGAGGDPCDISDSEESDPGLVPRVAREYKTVTTNSEAVSLYEGTTKVCRSCNYRILNDLRRHPPNHVILDPDTAAKEIKAKLEDYEINGPQLVARGDEAQHFCIAEREKLKRDRIRVNETLGEAYRVASQALQETKLQLIKALKKVFEERAEELDRVDSVLHRRQRILTCYDSILAQLIPLGRENHAAGINVWRKYCRKINENEHDKTLQKPTSLLYHQVGPYIDGIDAALDSVKKVADLMSARITSIVAGHVDRSIMKPDEIRNKIDGKVFMNLDTLRDAQRMQTLLGLPLTLSNAPGTDVAVYSRDIGPVTKSMFFYMIDTFHTRWTKVLVAIHDYRWLAVYVPDIPVVVDGDDPTLGFRHGEFADLMTDSHKPLYRRPPECVLRLSELKCTRFEPSTRRFDRQLTRTSTDSAAVAGPQRARSSLSDVSSRGSLAKTTAKAAGSPAAEPVAGAVAGATAEAGAGKAGEVKAGAAKADAAKASPRSGSKNRSPGSSPRSPSASPISEVAAKPEPGFMPHLIQGQKDLTPMARLLGETINTSGLEVLRIVNGKPVGWWIFVHPKDETVRGWATELGKTGPSLHVDDHWPSISSRYTPSTNPGTNAKALGIDMPPVGRRWAAVHVRDTPLNWEEPPT
ncbi:hypothetical protein GNI_004950 [Gregarina niphandrodes]|uniref:Uncharacterized protein n=1 Tax=Gregarina niphandrodes TaxID=110365 RepID=A0A023BDF7_GRENI|nr:hypothetical protein GNI_004950 [Gregarina niphandrodes]EZG88353.1 hypothetical protein GNI_004950 [Gregarina niphandrodes]|eukprot:XP_011128580.1 hypothetical protein GNI_004950 [Gregarina niphandrodes]